MKKKILVLGSSGQIGLHLCNYLNKFWKPKTSINLGIENVYQYYQKNFNKMKK